jgi:hypothetical protein
MDYYRQIAAIGQEPGVGKEDLTFWAGPVWEGDVPDAFVPGSKVLFIGCLGDRPPWCPDYGEGMKGSIDSLAGEAGIPRDQLGEIYMGAFSAGGSLLKRLLTNPEYRAATTSVILADATYTSTWDDETSRMPPVMYGFIDYCLDVLSSGGEKLFLATASINPNKTWATGIENIQRLRQEIERLTGRSFERLDHLFGVTTPADKVPGAVWKLGNVIFAEMSGDSDFGHGHTQISGEIWQQILIPWLEQGKGIISNDEQLSVSGLGEVTRYLPAAAGFAAGLLAVQLLTKE